MNLALRKPMTLAEFLEWEERQPLRYEFDGVGPVAMVGGTAGHADIQATSHRALRTRLRGKPCQLLWKRPQVSGRGRSGPLSRRHGRVLPHRSNRERRLRPRRRLRSAEPKHSARRQDRQSSRISGDPIRPALCHARTRWRQRHVYARSGETWTHEILVANSILALPEIEVELPLAELYEGIVFEAQDQSDQPPESEPT